MKLKKLCYIVFAALALCLVQNASAQDDHWTGLGNDGLWANPLNWSLGVVPPPGNPTTPYIGNVWLDAANGSSTITITNGEVESPGVGNSVEKYDTAYGPEYGVTLNIYGTLNFDWILYPVQNNPAAVRSYVNLRGNGVLSTSGAAIGVGDSWWYHEGPYVTMNLYNNAQYKSLGLAGLWLGGHVNIYDSATFLVNGYINMTGGNTGTPNQSDGTRAINIGGGTLILPEGYTNGANSSYNGSPGDIHDFIARGIVRAYGKGYDTNDLIMSDNGTNAIITTVSLGGALERIYFKPLPKTSVLTSTFQQASLVGDYPSVTGVLLSSSEPGLDPATFSHPLYTSSNPMVVTVDSNGVVSAVGPGSATVTATVGALTSTNTLSLAVQLAPSLLHRYSFNETSGTTAADSVGGVAWNATLVGSASFSGTGQVVLDGNTNGADYVQLPAGIVSGLNDVTIEAWASFGVSPMGSSTNNFESLFAFGFTDPDNLDSTYGDGGNYIFFQSHTGGGTATASYGPTLPGNAAPTDAGINSTLDGQTNMHIVVVFSPSSGSESVYTNGVLAATASLFNLLINPVAYSGPLFTNSSILAHTLGADPNNYLGHSLYIADPGLLGSIDEFRIYNGPLTAAQVAADYALGPSQLLGTSTTVSLSVSRSGSNVVISWPTSSAYLTLRSSPVLGPGAVWTPVSGPLTVSDVKYQMTTPITGNAQFFCLTP